MKTRKVRINKYLRMGLLLVSAILAIGSAGLMTLEYSKEHIREEKRSIYDYNVKSDVNYSVHVKPNILYENEELGEGEMYLTEFVDYITADFTHSFIGSEPIDVEGDYRVSAEVRGYTNKNDEKQIIWRKVFELIPEQSLKLNTDKHNVQKEIKVNFHEYNAFAQSVLQASKVNLSVELVVMMEGNQTLELPKGSQKDEIKTAISIPLNNGYFSITKEGQNDQSHVVEETVQVPAEADKGLIIRCGMALGIGGLGFIAILLFIGVHSLEDLKKKKIKKILNEHGSRMVVVDHMKVTEDLEVYHVSTIDDLIKIADEIEKPVFYEQENDLLHITKFYVKENGMLYIYEIEDDKILILEQVCEEKVQTLEEDITA